VPIVPKANGLRYKTQEDTNVGGCKSAWTRLEEGQDSAASGAMGIFWRFSFEDFLRRSTPVLAFDRDGLMHPAAAVTSNGAPAVEFGPTHPCHSQRRTHSGGHARSGSRSIDFESRQAGLRNSTFIASMGAPTIRPFVAHSNQIRQPIFSLPEHNHRAPIEIQDRRVVHVIDRMGLAGPGLPAPLQSGRLR
jgi:hypothetical protein